MVKMVARGARIGTPIKETAMPFVNIKITDENVTREQKAQLVKGVTQVLVDVLNKNPATTMVVIDEVKLDNWGINHELVSELRKKQ